MQRIFAGYNDRLAILRQSTNPLSKGVAWVEGQIVPMHEARIPLGDQGFLHGDLTYDVPAVWDGRYFRLDDHLTRLESSCAKMRMKLPLPREEVKRKLIEMVVRSEIQDAFVEIIVTRGMEGMRECRIRGVGMEDLTNNLYMFVVPYVWYLFRDMPSIVSQRC
jgi:branched-subunit amino acid aminotransferase/4-amino-4-deoxychorismate lyase